MPYCPDCGETVAPSHTYCQHCGCDLDEYRTDAGGDGHSSTETRGDGAAADRSGADDEASASGADHLPAERGDYVTPARVDKVADVLDEDEQVHYLTRGSTVDVEGSSAGTSLFGDDRSRKSGTAGYVRAAITDRRVVVKVPQWLGNDERSVPYETVTSVDLDTGLVNKRLSLQTPGQTYHIEAHEPDKDEVREAVRFVRERIASAGRDRVVVEGADEPDPTEQLKNLTELHEQGALTDAEFEAKKDDLLDEI